MKFLFTAICALLSFPVLAAPIEVNRGRIYKDLAQEKPVESIRSQVQLGVTSWQPHQSDFGGYHSQNFPELNLRFASPLGLFLNTNWNWVAGVGYLGLSQEGNRTLMNGAIVNDDHQISVIDLIAGVEAFPRALTLGKFSGFFGAGLMPAMFVFGHSLDEDGHSNGGLGAYGTVGGLYNFGGPKLDSLSIVGTAGYRGTLTGDIDVAGFEGLLGLRMGL